MKDAEFVLYEFEESIMNFYPKIMTNSKTLFHHYIRKYSLQYQLSYHALFLVTSTCENILFLLR